ncbi:hypothetical protein AK830_g12394 [Neonectria ditissima]|uniref:PPPDE domain-containing protein n=1 Tax=Neonectria ditissima TaxID=78410 RepID=A0A0N8H4S3_9HYPO|nr:hypothetical protein AK830_g12394 [Neonectria ditissima]
MICTVSLIVYVGSGARKPVPAHWGIFVKEEKASRGTVFHAVGSPFTGYSTEIKLNYSLEKTSRKHESILLASIDESQVRCLERVSKSLPAPGISPTPLDPFAGANCQDWAHDFIQALIDQGIIESSAMDILEAAPKV